MLAKDRIVAGHLSRKNGKYYTVINYYINGKRKEIWEKTGIEAAAGNKKKAEAVLMERRMNFIVPGSDIQLLTATTDEAANMLFADFMLQWLEIKRNEIRINTYAGYQRNIKNVIAPYFKEREIRLSELTPKHISDFYALIFRKGNSAGTVRSYHAVMHAALKYAVLMDIILRNPMDKIEKPKAAKKIYATYSAEELNRLICVSKETFLELPILFAAFYGMRREEVCGLRWDRIDFNNNTVCINHIVVMPKLDGKATPIAENNVKNKSSYRTLPLTDGLKERLLVIKVKQLELKKKFGNSYNHQWDGYICVKPNGDLITPNYVTNTFPQLLKKHNLRKIRFHDLRHTCATLMQKDGVDINHIKSYLGHSDISTTANIYSHIDIEVLLRPANKMAEIICLNEKQKCSNIIY